MNIGHDITLNIICWGVFTEWPLTVVLVVSCDHMWMIGSLVPGIFLLPRDLGMRLGDWLNALVLAEVLVEASTYTRTCVPGSS